MVDNPIACRPMPDLPVTTPFSAAHRAADIDLVDGAPVRAVFAGEVTHLPGDDDAGGVELILTGDNGWRAGYAHLQRVEVPDGARVRAGQVIALGGKTGHVRPGPGGDGSHLHLTLRDPDHVLRDPVPFLLAAPAALGTSIGSVLGLLAGLAWVLR